jgi:hypothetical protein
MFSLLAPTHFSAARVLDPRAYTSPRTQRRRVFTPHQSRRVASSAFCSSNVVAQGQVHRRRFGDLRRLRLSPIASMPALRIEALRAGGIGFRWTRARLAARGRVAESALGSPPRYHWQTRHGEASRCAHRALLDVADVVAEPGGTGRSPAGPYAQPWAWRPSTARVH